MEKERIPKETETIAVKRANRVAEKLRRARESIAVSSAWWGGAVFEVAALVLIFLLNVYLVLPFFGTSSVDTFFSGPIVPLLAKFIEIFGPPLSYSIQIVNIFFFLLFPISLYFFVRYITNRKLAALLAVHAPPIFRLIFHDYLAAGTTVIWLFIFWYFSYSYVLEERRSQ